ncbi:MAG: hypothetical protein HC833_18775 [Leptolyngbyaceae cyanobacterium RM1_406_9]|nr:hypothetical protein [Leptolyngbyaceae cyanobacterium RM1_406_9]
MNHPMTPIQVIGIGLDGAAGLPNATRKLIEQATLLVGSDRTSATSLTTPPNA